ncbi:hypothetical protein [Kitasatospora paranensis]
MTSVMRQGRRAGDGTSSQPATSSFFSTGVSRGWPNCSLSAAAIKS